MYSRDAAATPSPYRRYAVFDKHEGPIASLDFCSNSKFLRACATTGQLLACQAASGEEAALGTLNDVAWATESCPAGYACLGLWPDENADPATITARCGDTLCAGSFTGAVSARAYPCVDAESAVVATAGHAGPVAKMVYPSPTCLLSNGGDGFVLSWSVSPAAPPPAPAPAPSEEAAVEDAPADEE